MRRLLPLLLCGLLVACQSSPASSSEAPTEAAAPAASAAPDASPRPSSDWRRYPVPEGDTWPTRDLDDDRWVAVSSDLGCIGRAHQGDPGAHREALRRVLAHHATTAEAVMDYGIGVNAGDRAARLGERVATAVQNCR